MVRDTKFEIIEKKLFYSFAVKLPNGSVRHLQKNKLYYSTTYQNYGNYL